MNKRSLISRREALNRLWQITSLAASGASGFIGLRFLQSRASVTDFGKVITAGAVPDFEPGTVTLFSGGRFFLVRAADGGFLALYYKCTHLDCTVLWREEEQHFQCPCHGSQFALDGAVLKPPAVEALVRFPVAIADGQVQVDTGAFIRRSSLSAEDYAYDRGPAQ